MLNYIIKDKKLVTAEDENTCIFDSNMTFSIISPEELGNIIDINEVHHYTLKECVDNYNNARLDCHSKYSYGILSAVEILDNEVILIGFNFYLTKSSLLIVCKDENGLLNKFIQSSSDEDFGQKYEEITPHTLLLLLLDAIIESNEMHIEEVENSLEELEEEILIEAKKKYSKDIVAKRKLVMHLKHSIEPLAYAIKSLGDNENNLFSEHQVKLIEILAYKASKSVDNASLLRDYATQVREAFQAERDIASNDIMKVFTIVTSIFLPLTLIVGWYGMNFKSMPELDWTFGYTYVIMSSLVVVVSLLMYFKKKRWL